MSDKLVVLACELTHEGLPLVYQMYVTSAVMFFCQNHAHDIFAASTVSLHMSSRVHSLPPMLATGDWEADPLNSIAVFFGHTHEDQLMVCFPGGPTPELAP